MFLLFDAIAHLLVDALCAATVFGPVRAAGEFGMLMLLYNTLAFSTQCIVGIAADRIRRHGLAVPLSILITAAGFILPLPRLWRIVLIGCGNSVFHVAGGSRTLEKSGGRAGPLGVFVAPGAIGVTLGTLWPDAGVVFAALAVPVAVLLAVLSARAAKSAEDHGNHPAKRSGKTPVLPVILLTVAVAVLGERKADAVMYYGGINYTIDSRGMILEESYTVDQPKDLILITTMEETVGLNSLDFIKAIRKNLEEIL